jgi:putative sterol carrier protein
MATIFPSPEWLEKLVEKLNADEQYARIARNWEGDMACVLEPGGPLKEQQIYYLDLWHGKCRKSAILKDMTEIKPAFILKAPYENFARVVKGELDPMQAMLTRKLQVQGSMAYMMRNVPSVLDFVRCLKEITTEVLH